MIIILIIVLAILSFVFVVGYIISSVDPRHSITGYSIAISFVGIFSTFGGAYLGAKISGDNALKISEIERRERSLIEIKKIQNSIRLNQDGAIYFFDTIFRDYGFSNTTLKKELRKKQEEKHHFLYFINIFKKLNKNNNKNSVINKDMFEKLNDYIISLKKEVYRLHLLDNLNGNSKRSNYIILTIQLFDRLNLSAINESENSIDEWIMDCKSDYNKYLIIRMAHYIFKINDEIVEVDANEILEKSISKRRV